MICAEKSSKNFYFCCESKLFAMLHTEKEPLYGKTLTRLQSICTELGLPRFAAKQIARWLYVRRVTDFAQMRFSSDLNERSNHDLRSYCAHIR